MRLTVAIAVLALVAHCNADSGHPDTVIVETKYGKVEGDVIKVPEDNFLVAAFKGIPFGTAHRFQKPEPVKPWKETLNARNWGKRCYQHQIFGALEPQIAPDVGADCLHLNVFGPYDKGTPRPVMVFIYGGGSLWAHRRNTVKRAS
jgi:para-nitrobenzyl esterase